MSKDAQTSLFGPKPPASPPKAPSGPFTLSPSNPWPFTPGIRFAGAGCGRPTCATAARGLM